MQKKIETFLADSKIMCTFVEAMVFVPDSGNEIKRESGENPEQTRCCKLRYRQITIFRTTPLPLKRWRTGDLRNSRLSILNHLGRRPEKRVSQKTCRACGLKVFGDKA
jgi:hypothetical protein